MPYVMVPVPEEHVEEVMQFVLRTVARAAMSPWDAESIGALYTEVDELSRAVLAFTARSSVAGKELPESEAAALVQLSQREVVAIMRELNESSRNAERPQLIAQRTIVEALPNGRTQEMRVFAMDPEVAKLVSDAERAELIGDAPSAASSS